MYILMSIISQVFMTDMIKDSGNSAEAQKLKSYQMDMELGVLDAEYCASKDKLTYQKETCENAFLRLMKYESKTFINKNVEKGMDNNYLLLVYKKELIKARNATANQQKSIFTKFPFNLITDPYYKMKNESGFAISPIWALWLFPLLVLLHIYRLFKTEPPVTTP